MRTHTHEHTNPLHALALHGDLDMATAPLLEDRVRDLLDHGAIFVVVDVSDVNFVDSAGLRSLIHVDQLAAQHDAVVRLVGLTPAMRRILELSGLIDRLRIAP
jgi:anti-sigma B factor antagonist